MAGISTRRGAGRRLDGARTARGMAVVAVLMVVAVIAVIASALLGRQSAVIRAAQSDQTGAQARWLLRGEIARAQVLLRAEARREIATRLDGAWAAPVAGQALGTLEGAPALAFTEITDEQARFNLRNLVRGGRLDAVEGAAFLRLCAMTGVPPEQAARIARRVVTSLAEADRASAEPPSTDPKEMEDFARVAGQLGVEAPSDRDLAPRLRVVEDLLGTPGVEAGSVARLRPFVTVLPRRTWINANTARPEVIAAWVPGLSLDRAREVLQLRDRGQWFLNRGDFVHRLQIPGLDDAEVLIGINSEWFRVSTALRMSRTTLLMQALLHDDKSAVPRLVWIREGA